MNNIWIATLWKKRTDIDLTKAQSGLRMCVDKNLNENLRRECKKFAVFLRREYFFPVRIYVNVKEKKQAGRKRIVSELRTKSNETVLYSSIEIRINDMEYLLHKKGELEVQNIVLKCIARELTNYFQWLNQYTISEKLIESYVKDVLFDYESVREKLGGKYSWHLWDRTDWEKLVDPEEENLKTGLRMFIDRDLNTAIREACKKFGRYLRKTYYFPVRVPVYVKNYRRILASDGDKVTGLFVSYDDYKTSPEIWVAAGDYQELLEKYDQDRADEEILRVIAHELSHYFQWLNAVELTPRGAEWQASWYARMVFEEYLADCYENENLLEDNETEEG